eukprot:6179485-Pleurochrysis_carterae.AAC.1
MYGRMSMPRKEACGGEGVRRQRRAAGAAVVRRRRDGEEVGPGGRGDKVKRVGEQKGGTFCSCIERVRLACNGPARMCNLVLACSAEALQA